MVAWSEADANGRRSPDDAWRTQLMKAGLELCLLALLEEQPRHGYGLLKELGSRGFVVGNERSVYPLLKKMAREGLIAAGSPEPSRDGRPARTSYRLLPEGEKVLRARSGRFREFAMTVEGIVGNPGGPAKGRAGG